MKITFGKLFRYIMFFSCQVKTKIHLLWSNNEVSWVDWKTISWTIDNENNLGLVTFLYQKLLSFVKPIVTRSIAAFQREYLVKFHRDGCHCTTERISLRAQSDFYHKLKLCMSKFEFNKSTIQLNVNVRRQKINKFFSYFSECNTNIAQIYP